MPGSVGLKLTWSCSLVNLKTLTWLSTNIVTMFRAQMAKNFKIITRLFSRLWKGHGYLRSGSHALEFSVSTVLCTSEAWRKGVLEPSNSSASGCQALSDSSVNKLIAEGAEEVPTIQAVTKWAHDACTRNHWIDLKKCILGGCMNNPLWLRDNSKEPFVPKGHALVG